MCSAAAASRHGVATQEMAPQTLLPLFAGYLAIVGRPNAGKSTLLNALLGQKLSIVTFKAQTTRHRVVGILSNDTSQIILVDTPGFILKTRNKLEQVMMNTVRRSLKDSDAVLVLIDLTIDHKEQLAMLAPPPDAPPTAIVLNKIDTVPVRPLPPVHAPTARWLPAARGQGQYPRVVARCRRRSGRSSWNGSRRSPPHPQCCPHAR